MFIGYGDKGIPARGKDFLPHNHITHHVGAFNTVFQELFNLHLLQHVHGIGISRNILLKRFKLLLSEFLLTLIRGYSVILDFDLFKLNDPGDSFLARADHFIKNLNVFSTVIG